MRALLAAGCLVPGFAFAQAPVVPTTPQNEAMMRSLQEQRAAFDVYQKCVDEHRREVELHYAADNLLRYRDQRAMMEAAYQTNPQARERYPGGVEQMVSAEFARYKSLGGAAASIGDVRAVPSPCATPGPTFPQRPATAGSPITDKRTIIIQPK